MGNSPPQSAQTRLRKPAEQIAKPARKTGRAMPSVFFQDSSPLQNYVVQFVNNFDAASAPQITQNVGAGQVETATRLARRSCRICLLLFLLLFFPLWSELEFLMGLWLGSKMPPETVGMARWTLLVAAVATTSAGLGQLINALGRIKWYKIEMTVLFLLCLADSSTRTILEMASGEV